jgi:hypothetical protein
VAATLISEVRRVLEVDAPARPYVASARVDHGLVEGDRVVCDSTRCTVRYRFELAKAAEELANSDVAAAYGGAIVAPASAWLLHPRNVVASSIELDVRGDAAVLSGWPEAAGDVQATGAGSIRAYGTHDTGLDESPWFAFGQWTTRFSEVRGRRLTVGLAKGPWAMDDAAITHWITTAATQVSDYIQTWPLEHALVIVVRGEGETIDGKTLGGGGGSIFLELGADVTELEAQESWVLVHEFVHLTLPALGPPHQWLEEGLATYLEPIVRARTGAIPAERVWADIARDGPQGLPAAGDQGLERTHTWERTYWGGALFCLAADVAIREQTGNRRTLDDALRAVARATRGVADRITMDRFLELGDRATGLHVLHDAYRRLGLSPGRIDLEGLLRDLGVERHGDRVVLDDRARLAGVRRAITGAR